MGVVCGDEGPDISVRGYLQDGKTPAVIELSLRPTAGDEFYGELRIVALDEERRGRGFSMTGESVRQFAVGLDGILGYASQITGDRTATMMKDKFSAETTRWPEQSPVEFRSFFAKSAQTEKYRSYFELAGEDKFGIILSGAQTRALAAQLAEQLPLAAQKRQSGMLAEADAALQNVRKARAIVERDLVALQEKQQILATHEEKLVREQSGLLQRMEQTKAGSSSLQQQAERLLIR